MRRLISSSITELGRTCLLTRSLEQELQLGPLLARLALSLTSSDRVA